MTGSVDDQTRIFADDDVEQLKKGYEETAAGEGPEEERRRIQKDDMSGDYYTRIFTDEDAEQLKSSLAFQPENEEHGAALTEEMNASAVDNAGRMSDAGIELSIAEKVRKALNAESDVSLTEGGACQASGADEVGYSETAEIRAAINADMAELAKEIETEPSVAVPAYFDDKNIKSGVKAQGGPDAGTEMRTQGSRTRTSAAEGKGARRAGTDHSAGKAAGTAKNSASPTAAHRNTSSGRGASGTGNTASSAKHRTSAGTGSGTHEKNGTRTAARTAVGAPRKGEGTTSKKRRRRKKSKYVTRTTGQKVRTVVISILIWALVIFAGYQGYRFGYTIFYDVAMDETDLSRVSITITGEETDEEIGEMLLDMEMIDDMDIFLIRCKLYNAEYIAGTYSLSRSYNTEKILNILAGYDYSEGQLTE